VKSQVAGRCCGAVIRRYIVVAATASYGRERHETQEHKGQNHLLTRDSLQCNYLHTSLGR